MPLTAHQKAARIAQKRIEMILTSSYEEIPNAVAIILGQNQHTNTPRPSGDLGPDSSAHDQQNDGAAPAPAVISEHDASACMHHIVAFFNKLEEIASEGNPLAFLSLAQLLSESFGAHEAAEAAWRAAFAPATNTEGENNNNNEGEDDADEEATATATQLLLSLERLFKTVFVNRGLREPTLADIDGAACVPQQKLCSFLCESADGLAVGELLVIVGAVCAIGGSPSLKDRCGAMFLPHVRDALIQHTRHVADGLGPLFSFSSLRALGTVVIHLINGSRENKSRLPSWAFVCDAMAASSDLFFQIQCVEILFRIARPDPRLIDEWRHRCANDRVRSVVLSRLRHLLPTPAADLFKGMAEVVEAYNLDAVPKREQTLVALPAKAVTVGPEGNDIVDIYRVYFTPNSFTILLDGPSADNITVPYTCIRSVKIARDNCFAFKLNLAPQRVREHVLVDTVGHECITIEVTNVAAKTFKASPVQKWIMEALERRKHMSTANRRAREAKESQRAMEKEERRAIREKEREREREEEEAREAKEAAEEAKPASRKAAAANKKKAAPTAAAAPVISIAAEVSRVGGEEGDDDNASAPPSTTNKKAAAAAKKKTTAVAASGDEDAVADTPLHQQQQQSDAKVKKSGAADGLLDDAKEALASDDIDTDPQLRDAVRRFSTVGGNTHSPMTEGEEEVTAAAKAKPKSSAGSHHSAKALKEQDGDANDDVAPPRPSVPALRPAPATTAVRLDYENSVTPTHRSFLLAGRHRNGDGNESPLCNGEEGVGISDDEEAAAVVAMSDESPLPPPSAADLRRRQAGGAPNSFMAAATAGASAAALRSKGASSKAALAEMVPSPEPGLKQFGSGSPMHPSPPQRTAPQEKEKNARDGAEADVANEPDRKRGRAEAHANERTGYQHDESLAAVSVPPPAPTPLLDVGARRTAAAAGDNDCDGAEEEEFAVVSNKRSAALCSVLPRNPFGAVSDDDDDADVADVAAAAPRRSDRLSDRNGDDGEVDANAAGTEPYCDSRSGARSLPPPLLSTGGTVDATTIGTALAALARMSQHQQSAAAAAAAAAAGGRAGANNKKRGRSAEDSEEGGSTNDSSLARLAAELSAVVVNKVNRLRGEATEVISSTVGAIQLSVNASRTASGERRKTLDAMVREGLDAALQAEADIAATVEAALASLNDELVTIRREGSSEVKDRIAFLELEARQAANVTQEAARRRLSAVKATVDDSMRTMAEAIEYAFGAEGGEWAGVGVGGGDGDGGSASLGDRPAAAYGHNGGGHQQQQQQRQNPMEALKRFLSQQLEQQMMAPPQHGDGAAPPQGHHANTIVF